jgi:lysophospholipid acyltransferase (LPLAT)-like uncharacterized protein
MKAPSRWGRRVLRSSRLRLLLCWAIHLYIRFVYATNRWRVQGGEVPRRLREGGNSFVLAFWHGRLMMIPMAWQRLAPMHMLISAHRDGRIIADAVTYFGVNSIAGSSRRGGTAALRTMLRRLKAGDCIGITRMGRARQCGRAPGSSMSPGSPGADRADRLATSRAAMLRSWDRFHLALPFGRGVFLWGEPIEMPDLDQADRIRPLLVESRMNAMATEADRRVGHGPPVQEGPSPALREREGPAPKAWEGEGHILRRPSPSHRFAMGSSLSRNVGAGYRP